MRILNVTAKCSDLCFLIMGSKEYSGYVPNWLPSKKTEHWGDYVVLEIDIDTGKTLNWESPTEFDLKQTFDK